MRKTAATLKALARSTLRKAGFEVINLAHNERYGWDWIRDVQRLAPLVDSRIATIFDVGANSGETTLELLAAFPNARIHSFEPTPATYQLLTRTLAGQSRVTTHQVALGPSNGTATMQCFGSSLLNSCAAEPPFNARFPQDSTSIQVPMRTIDDFCAAQSIERIALLKIDAEGFDLRILMGASRMLAEGRVDFVVTEINGAAPREVGGGSDLFSISGVLNPAGFRFVSTYTDGVAKTLPFYLMSNALFVRAGTGER